MASPIESAAEDGRRATGDGPRATDGAAQVTGGGVGSAPVDPSPVADGPPSGESEPGEEAGRAPRAGGLNPIAIMVGVGLLMLAVIAVASALRQPVSDSIQGGARPGTGQLVPSGMSVGEGPRAGSV